MSDTPNESSGDGSQGEQPQDGQPPGGQVPQEQATGGQRGQPRGGAQPQGQPAGGQVPQGGRQDGAQPQGQPPQGNYQTGPSVSDIFSRTDTLDQIKFGVVLYAIVGFGIGLGLFGVGSAFSGGSGLAAQLGASFAVVASVGVPIAATAVLAFFVGREINDELGDLQDNLVFATAGVTAFAGSVVAFLLSWILFGLGTGSINFGDFLLPIILTGIGAAVIAAGTIWADENLLTPSGAPPQGRQQY
ncbi:hypothetical protein [Salinibaculum salinum]|uniref:hypothetical protein n=1 Tax=Salinibaculum salinum TaxID=3131996 RepID=UPI0030EF2051